MENFDKGLLDFIFEELEQPRCAAVRMRIQRELGCLMAGLPNAGLIVRTTSIVVEARSDLVSLVVEVKCNGRKLEKSELTLTMVKLAMREDYFIAWLLG